MQHHLAENSAYDLEIADAEGCFVFDSTGKKYIDFIGGWCVGTLGWKNPEIIKAINEAREKALYIPPIWRWQKWEEFAKFLCEIAPGRLTRAFRCTSGSEAVEFAIKLARAATGKKLIISLDGVYHGHTYGAASIGTALSFSMAPGIGETIKLPLPDEYRNRWDLQGAELSEKILQEFEKLAQTREVAAFISEPIFTNAGAVVPPADLYPKLAELCRHYGILLVMDEVASGFGRTGELFASEHWKIMPDIICLGKAFSGGYATIGAVLISEEVFSQSRKIPTYSTFGWLPLDMEIARTNIELVLRDRLWENSAKIGRVILEILKPLEDLPQVGTVRGLGLLAGIELVEDKKTKKRAGELAEKIRGFCLETGLMIDTAHPGTLFMSPPLILDEKTAREGAEILKKAVERHCRP